MNQYFFNQLGEYVNNNTNNFKSGSFKTVPVSISINKINLQFLKNLNSPKNGNKFIWSSIYSDTESENDVVMKEKITDSEFTNVDKIAHLPVSISLDKLSNEFRRSLHNNYNISKELLETTESGTDIEIEMSESETSFQDSAESETGVVMKEVLDSECTNVDKSAQLLVSISLDKFSKNFRQSILNNYQLREHSETVEPAGSDIDTNSKDNMPEVQ